MTDIAPPATTDATIARLGTHGDGIADTPSGPLYVAYTAPGDHIRCTRDGARGHLVDVITPSPDRAVPLCRHFTICGGCATQHVTHAAEARWKSALVRTAFSQHGIEAPMSALIASAPHTRRRAVFAARRTNSGVVFGFHEPQGHAIVDLAECPILAPAIVATLPALRALADALLSRSGEAHVTVVETETGVDVAVTGAKPTFTVDDRSAISERARAAGIIRLSLEGTPVFATAEPTLTFGRARVAVPPGVFLQAVPSAEAAMTGLIVKACGKSKRIADLFSGLGTFTFPLAARAEVAAFDNDRAAIEALLAAVKRTSGIKPVTARVRDLYSDPLSARELAAFDAVVFDPPRAGADAQAQRLAKSQVPVVVAVSCAPGSLARDVRTLIDGGYALESVTPIDQFLFAPHVEAIAILTRPRKRG